MWHRVHFIFPVLCLCSVAIIFAASGKAAELSDGGTAIIADIIDADTLALRNGTVVRLTGIQAPKLPPDRPAFQPWPFAERARATLEYLTLGKTVTLSYGGARRDRHGRTLAHLHLLDGTWVQGEMLRRGMARVYSFADNRAGVDEMLAIERTARNAKRGIWQHPFYQVRSTGALNPLIDSFQIVEGQILDVARIGKYTYLNFGPDYRTDFTVSVRRANLRLFAEADIDLLALRHRTVRARGWISKHNGPMIELTHPEQLELVR